MNKMKIFLLNIVLFLFGIFLFASSTFAQESKFYNIDLLYDKGKIEFKTIAVLLGDISQIPQEGEYRIELISLSGTSLYNDHFQVPLSMHGEDFGSQTAQPIFKTMKTDNVKIILNIPYFSNGKEVNIYDVADVKILTISVQQFSKITPLPISPTPVFKPTLAKDNGGGNALLYVGLGGLVFGVAFAAYLKFKKPQNQIQ